MVNIVLPLVSYHYIKYFQIIVDVYNNDLPYRLKYYRILYYKAQFQSNNNTQ